jgi:hypothetical protein
MPGAIWAGWVVGTWNPAAPFLLCAGLMGLAATFAILFIIGVPWRSVAGVAGTEPAISRLLLEGLSDLAPPKMTH